LDQDSTIIVVVEMSQSSWLVAGMLPGIERQPRKKLEPSAERLHGLLHRWRDEAVKAGRKITRIALAFEGGRDGFWLARWLRARGVEAHVIHASSVAVSREHRRAKTDRRRETRHSVAPRIHALSVHRVDRHPRLRGRVLSADRLYHGCGVVDFSGSGHGGRPDLAYEKRAKRHPGMVGVISHRPVRYLSHITVISGAQNRQARRPKNAAVFLVFGAGSLFRLTKSTRTPLENRWLFDGALYKK
jgi:hypothetical protein